MKDHIISLFQAFSFRICDGISSALSGYTADDFVLSDFRLNSFECQRSSFSVMLEGRPDGRVNVYFFRVIDGTTYYGTPYISCALDDDFILSLYLDLVAKFSDSLKVDLDKVINSIQKR